MQWTSLDYDFAPQPLTGISVKPELPPILQRLPRWRSRDDAVAGGVEDAAPVRRDQLIDDGATCLRLGERAGFIPRHQPAIAGNVGGEDRGQFCALPVGRTRSAAPRRSIAIGGTAARLFNRRSLPPNRTGADCLLSINALPPWPPTTNGRSGGRTQLLDGSR
jgi:hypothetical protein